MHEAMVASDLREQLQSSLGNAYELQRELGGGGMSRVFLAEDTLLGRAVVVKVIAPELAAGLNVERFRREIQLAAKLQHPHIVPVLSAGEADGLPYYTMPLVEGESLRSRLARGGALPVDDAVSILRDVAKALAYAHAHGVVHRDIKPDNVLLAAHDALVTDFGVAKAISSAREEPAGATLTALGAALGTPAYMAPEQVAADPATDHRADLYSFGAMAYELLAGRPPFVGLTPQRLLAAHISERPQPLHELRPDVPPTLSALVMRCLEKDPAARPQSALDVLASLAQVSSGGHTVPLGALPTRRALVRALVLYAAAFLGVALLARVAIEVIGLPDWVFTGALLVMALGLPVVLLTGLLHHQARVTRTAPTMTPGGTPIPPGTFGTLATKASRHITWRRVALIGAAAVTVFAMLVAGYMTLRSLGIGPAGSLIAAGVLGDRERVLVADFRSPVTDTSLGPVVSEAVEADLAQSASLSVVQPAMVREVLQRMRRPAGARVDLALAREIATREGIKAIVDGDVIALGGGYVISARLVAAPTGEVLASFRATADEPKAIIPAVDRLSRHLRAKIGESLKSIRATPPLEQVTTGSLEALRKYAQGTRAVETRGEMAEGAALLEQAIALDTGFAMAYRKLAIVLSNYGGQTARVRALLQQAFDHRDRLSDAERYVTEGTYYTYGPAPDAAKAIAAYESALDGQPDNATALNNVSVLYQGARQYRRAEAYLRRAIAADPMGESQRLNLAVVQVALGRPRDAAETAERMARSFPGNPTVTFLRAQLAAYEGRHDSAVALLRALRTARASDPTTREEAAFMLANEAELHGRLVEAREWLREAETLQAQRGVAMAPLDAAIEEAVMDAWFLGERQRAARRVDAALALHPLDSIPAVERPYARLATVYSLTGRPERARAMLAAFDRRRAAAPLLDDATDRHLMLGDIAVAERRYDDAVREYRASDSGECDVCALPRMAVAYDLAGNADSAIALFGRYLVAPSLKRVHEDGTFLAAAENRLGELYEARGDARRAAEHYGRFVALWARADPELLPRVERARQRLARLGPREAALGPSRPSDLAVH
ncbi:MAG TPA: protein kinase [Gemmatimonadaceae bacterium]|nr:protein kinase [Gemmatimonadaceae bacterium]